ncbi:hypothetical protein L1987_11945 [Smallanthus sonchifolius]|uniref:Uncharacterized protein n=1 Tax=Smallanthus sonchifolius TaxID=185202 RepID=A0ACB9JFU2_9ASTR|nr:hypothetical protein L1987_11945 [Smallanthus sonchifolius]
MLTPRSYVLWMLLLSDFIQENSLNCGIRHRLTIPAIQISAIQHQNWSLHKYAQALMLSKIGRCLLN